MKNARLAIQQAVVGMITGVTCLTGSMAMAASPNAVPDQAKQLLETSAVKGGLILHLGCGDGKLTAALRLDNSLLVHGLDADAKNIEAARANIQSLGLYGPVTVEQWSNAKLPYADNLANLVVVSGKPAADQAEILRVLAPGGVALYLNAQGKVASKLTKPRPKDIDEWTHFLHDAGNNAVAADQQVGPPRSLQWVADPLWLRSHETPSGIEAMVCSANRVFYFFDEGVIGITDQRLPERWALLCRDAFNGKLLWRCPIGSWGWPQWATNKFAGHDWTTITGGRTVVPDENQRRLVVAGDRLYATLNYQAPLSILDAASGKVLATVAQTAPARQFIAADGIVVVYSHTGNVQQGESKAKGKAKAASKAGGAETIFGIDGNTGAVLWRKPVSGLHALSLAINQGRVLYEAEKTVAALELKTGKPLWEADLAAGNLAPLTTLVAHDGKVIVRNRSALAVFDAPTGRKLWQKPIAASMMGEDLFVIKGVVWPGADNVGKDQNAARKEGINALAIGYDLQTGAERKRVFVPEMISPEHHHRCYRNKATTGYIISSMEGAEFIDLEGTSSCQNNFLRGACKLGMVPCNGLLYVPADQCFCQPGAKVLGIKAIGPAPARPLPTVPDEQRLQKGPAYGQVPSPKSEVRSPADWPTFRYDAARHGASPAEVPSAVAQNWQVSFAGAALTAPVAVGDRVYVAERDNNTLHALDARTGRTVWSFVTGGRIDSPPTISQGMVLLGSGDGWLYCLKADDGKLAWRFLAAPSERRILAFERLESVWPVHGSVLVQDGVAYLTAGRSSYLDGGIYLYGLDPQSGRVRCRTVLSGPFPDGGKTVPRDVSFFIPGANSDVLAAEGDAIYMRQKKFTPSLKEQPTKVVSSKGEADIGRHVFSTAGFLDDTWYNRAFWMYSKRWPGFQLANQAPKSGQLLIVDDTRTYAVQPYYRRNVHSPMFFPGKEGYLLYADANDNEPQIMGDEGARTPVAWLPQSDYQASRALQNLSSPAFGLDKMMGYTRAAAPAWKLFLPVRIRAMVKAGDTLFVAGPPDELDAADPYAALDGRKGARMVAVGAKEGKKLAEYPLQASPIFDGLIAAGGKLFMSTTDGKLSCFSSQTSGGSSVP